MNSKTVSNGEIVGTHSGAAVPDGNIAVTDEQLAAIRVLQQEGVARSVRPLWNDGSPMLPADMRPVIQVTVNGSTDDAVVFTNTPFEISMTSDYIPDGRLIVDVFGRLFALDFVGGVGTKTVSSATSGEYVFGNNLVFRANTLKLQIVE